MSSGTDPRPDTPPDRTAPPPGPGKIESVVRTAVTALAMDHEIVPCDPALADTAAFCAHYGFSPEESANTILVASRRPKGLFGACVVLATTRLDVNRKVRDLLGVKKVSFADGETTETLTGMTIGGVTPFGLPTDLPLWIDRRVMECNRVILGGGSRSIKILIPPEALTRVGGVVVDDLAMASDPH